MFLELVILAFILTSILSISYVLLPASVDRYHRIQERKVSEATRKLENLFFEIEKRKITLIFFFSPFALGLAGFLLFQNIFVAIAGVILGTLLPNVFIKIWEKRRNDKFELQLLDGLLVLSGSLKAGLSLLQSLEVLVEDSPPPLSQEFGWVLKEVKMGMSLEESLRRLNKRMYSEELTLFISSTLVAEETGGDITKVFSRLATTLRNNRKLKDNIKTLTLQGKLQGIIMSALPVVFVWWVLTFNKGHFDIMFTSDLGRFLLLLSAFLQVLGSFLIYKFSKIKI